MKVYMMTTNDKYRLPVAVADSVAELSELTGKSKSTIKSAISRLDSGKIKDSIFCKVEIGDE